MTIQDLAKALHDHGGGVRVVTRSGKLYDVERDVILANIKETNPLIYGWPVKPGRRAQCRWFKPANLRIAGLDDTPPAA